MGLVESARAAKEMGISYGKYMELKEDGKLPNPPKAEPKKPQRKKSSGKKKGGETK